MLNLEVMAGNLPLYAAGTLVTLKLLAGSLLVFALSISAYVTPSLMGGTDVLTLPMLIAQQVGTSFNPNFAGALGVILLLVSLAIVVAYNRILARLAGGQGMA